MKIGIKNIFALIVAAVLLVVAMPRTPNFNYDYKIGSPWGYGTIFAEFDFPILKSDEQIQAERFDAVSVSVPYYRFSEEILENSLKAAEAAHLGAYKSVVVEALKSVMEKGVVTDEGLTGGNKDSEVIFIQRNLRATKYPSVEIYTLAQARKALLEKLSRHGNSASMDSLLRVSGVYSLVVPDLVFDRQTTDLFAQESGNRVSTTMGYVNAGQLVVKEGDVVTPELAQILDSYKAEYESMMGPGKVGIMFWLGNTLVAISLLALLVLSVGLTSPKIFSDNRFLYILTVFTIFALCTLLIQKLGENLLYMFPYTLAALYLQAFMKPKVIMPVYFVTLLPLLIFSYQGTVLFVSFLVAGTISLVIFRYFHKGWKQFVCALIVFAILSAVYFGFRSADMVSGNVIRRLTYFFVASMLSVAGYPLIYLFEKLFNLVSNSRLVELSDTSNKVLRELEKKAPGTLQHSLMVMNMADSVARAIDANPLLVRAGALYHDIGKMANPLCFVENESLITTDANAKYHSSLTPLQSAKDIISHVTDGLSIAEKAGLPGVVRDFILTHHGTSRVRFFYSKYLEHGGDPSAEAEFRYPGKKPVTSEQIILMLCDTAEAASRTLSDYSPESCSAFIENLVAAKMEEGQFDDAEISIAELGIAKDVMKKYLAQSHHERVVYPDQKDNSKKRKILWK